MAAFSADFTKDAVVLFAAVFDTNSFVDVIAGVVRPSVSEIVPCHCVLILKVGWDPPPSPRIWTWVGRALSSFRIIFLKIAQKEFLVTKMLTFSGSVAGLP